MKVKLSLESKCIYIDIKLEKQKKKIFRTTREKRQIAFPKKKNDWQVTSHR